MMLDMPCERGFIECVVLNAAMDSDMAFIHMFTLFTPFAVAKNDQNSNTKAYQFWKPRVKLGLRHHCAPS